jgi:hypothetical protein
MGSDAAEQHLANFGCSSANIHVNHVTVTVADDQIRAGSIKRTGEPPALER